MKKLLILCFLITSVSLYAQSEQQPPYTPGKERLKSFDQRKSLIQQSLVNNVAFESVGPTVFSGRVVDVDVNPEDPTIFYVAYASGGLWYTENNGTTLTPVFDQEAVMTIGDNQCSCLFARAWRITFWKVKGAVSGYKVSSCSRQALCDV